MVESQWYSMLEIERRLFWTKTIIWNIWNTLKHRITSRFDTLSRNIATIDSCRRGHEKSPAVFRQNILIGASYSNENTIDLFRLTIQIDWCATWPFRIRSWPWASVKLSKWPFKVKIYFVRRVYIDKRNTLQVKKCRIFTESKVITEKNVFRKNGYFYFLLCGWLWWAA